MNTVTSGMDALNSAPVGPTGVGAIGIDRAKNLASSLNSGTTPGTTEQPAGVAAQPTNPNAPIILKPRGPTIDVISGVRVFDAVTHELIDDAQLKQLPEREKDKYFDDATHGDLVAGDKTFTRIDGDTREVIGLGNQRVKEKLVQALVNAEAMDPLDFFGHHIMAIDNVKPTNRDKAWRMVPDPDGGPGRTLAEVPVEKPQAMPNYREAFQERDQKSIKPWSYSFLQEYRLNKDSLTSEFYPLYIPLPPVPPNVMPPLPSNWMPFSDPGAAARHKRQAIEAKRAAIQQIVGDSNRAGGMMGGMPGMGGGGFGGGGGGGGGMRR